MISIYSKETENNGSQRADSEICARKLRCRLRYCIWKSWKKPKRRIRAFIQLGVSRSWAMRYGYSRMSGWAIACSPIMGTTITEVRLRRKGYIPLLEYYHQICKELEKKVTKLFYEPPYSTCPELYRGGLYVRW